MIITISGVPGSGKTTVAQLLAERLGYPFYSMGELRGKMALERGLTINELNALGESDPTTDTGVDEYQKELGKKEKDFVIEGRLSWYFIPHSFKVLLLCDAKEAARRIFTAQRFQAQKQNDEPLYHTLEEAQQKLEERVTSDHLRYQKYYHISNYLDPTHYDLILDTTAFKDPQETAEHIFKKIV